MKETGHIEICVKGNRGGNPLSPANYDITELAGVLEHVSLFFDKSKNRPPITYKMEEGSVRHLFVALLTVVNSFNKVLANISENRIEGLSNLDKKQLDAIRYFYAEARGKDMEFEISTSLSNSARFVINKETPMPELEGAWPTAEFYFYGEVMDIGGKSNPNIHLQTEEHGLLKIDAEREMLASLDSNLLYKFVCIHATGRQNPYTSEINKASLNLVSVEIHKKVHDENYLLSCIEAARHSWSDVGDVEVWLQNIRGNDE